MPIASLLIAVTLAAAPPDEAPAARDVWSRYEAALDAMRHAMPAFAASADEAARRLVAGDDLGVRGSSALASEFAHRPGGLQWYLGTPGDDRGVVLLSFVPPRSAVHSHAWLTHRLADAQAVRDAGGYVVGIGAASRIAAHGLDPKGICNTWIDLPAAQSGDDAVLLPAAAWAWQCELFAAFTRLDRVPVIRRSPETDTRHAWLHRYGTSQRFHDDRWLDPIPPGSLGTRYLDELRAVMRDVGTASWDELAEAAHRGRAALQSGGRIFVRTSGYPAHLVREPFTPLDHDGSNPALPAPGLGDFVLAVGASEAAGSTDWGDPDLLRAAGHGVAWIVSRYNTHPHDVLPNEILVDLWSPVGDAAVRVDHYDAPLGPVASIVASMTLEAIRAEAEVEPRMNADGRGSE